MKNRWIVLSALGLSVGTAMADALPVQVGKCALTTVKEVGQRLEDGVTHQPIPDSGSQISFVNGGGQVSYEQVEAVNRSSVGDQVVICLIELPRDCPPGDERGKVYTTTNLTTLEIWTLPDSSHMCGGA